MNEELYYDEESKIKKLLMYRERIEYEEEIISCFN